MNIHIQYLPSAGLKRPQDQLTICDVESYQVTPRGLEVILKGEPSYHPLFHVAMWWVEGEPAPEEPTDEIARHPPRYMEPKVVDSPADHAPMPIQWRTIARELRPESQYPIARKLGTDTPWPTEIPWGMIESHEQQAQTNHDQSLQRLFDRQGLSWAEALAIVRDEHWRTTVDMSDEAAAAELQKAIDEWTAAQ